MEKIRLLTAEDIECRIGTTKKSKQNPDVIEGVSLLLYKNARVDMVILDETFGPMNWQRHHEFKDGKLYCTVSVYDKENQQWIDKEDVGVESNAEAEKGQASDAFKRACFNWGIGRELYTAPFIWITPNSGENLKYTKFTVADIAYQDGKIVSLQITDDKGNVRFRLQPQISVDEIKKVTRQYLMDNSKARDYYCGQYNVPDIDKLPLVEIYKNLKDNKKI